MCLSSDVNKDWSHRAKDKDQDLAFKAKHVIHKKIEKNIKTILVLLL